MVCFLENNMVELQQEDKNPKGKTGTSLEDSAFIPTDVIKGTISMQIVISFLMVCYCFFNSSSSIGCSLHN